MTTPLATRSGATTSTLSRGQHNSAFSPEDLCSNFVGTVVARLAIGEGGTFPRKVDAKLATVLKALLAQTPAETEKAFNKVKNKWVNFVNSDSWKKDDYLRRRNFTRRPFKVGHPQSMRKRPPGYWLVLATPRPFTLIRTRG